MPLQNLIRVLCFSILTLISFSNLVSAQTLIEKSLVAKSKLHNPVWLKHDPASTLKVNHASWDMFLKRYTNLGSNGIRTVAYSTVSRADTKLLKSYLSYLQSVDITRLNRNEQYAFWLNLYNASIIDLVLANWPIRSVREIKSNPLDLKGPFNDTVAVVSGHKLTPDTIESGIVRPIWKDARLHYGFNCAAISCPNIFPEAFKGSEINAQLNTAAKSFINDRRGVRFENGKLVLSKIFFWYSEDYGGTEAALLNHISRFASPELALSLSEVRNIDRYEYDWALNGR